MPYWLNISKSARQQVAFALVSLVLSACSTLPKADRPLTAAPALPRTATAEAVSEASGIANAPPGYYDTTGTLYTQDEVDELLGVTEMEPVALSPEELAKFGDIWERVRAGFRLNLNQDNQRIAAQRNWFAQRQDYLDRMSARASHYIYHTVTEAEKRGVPTELALLPVIESSYDPFAYSPAQAAGMWQFIPGTGRIYGLKQNYWYDGRRDVMESTRAAYEYLTRLHDKFGSWELALAAYNAGPGTIERAINKNAAAGLGTDYWSLDLPGETMAYVPRFLAVAQLIQSPKTYGITLRPIVNQPHFREVVARSQVDLAAVARLAGLTLKQLYQLNPGYTRWATDPETPHHLLVPIDTPADFEARLAALPAPERLVVQRYQVKRGDTLYKIADRFDTTPAELKRLNKLSGRKANKPAVGRWLVVSRSRERADAYDEATNPAVRRLAQLVKDSGQVREELDPRAPLSTMPDSSNTVAADKTDKSDTADKAASKVASARKDKSDKSDKADKARDDDKQARRDNDKSKADDTPAPSKDYHKVKAGETLYRIARSYGVSPLDLARWNHMRANDSLHPGKRLLILVAADNSNTNDDNDRASATRDNGKAKGKEKDKSKDSAKAERVAERGSKAKGRDKGKDKEDKDASRAERKKTSVASRKERDDKDTVKRIRYEVKRGDTLYSISQRYKVSVSQIQTWNKGRKTIKPGEDLVLFLAKN